MKKYQSLYRLCFIWVFSLCFWEIRNICVNEHLDDDQNYQCHFRFYDSKLGRFIQADQVIPKLTSQMASHHTYVYNNPIKHTDPTGHLPQDLNTPADESPFLPSMAQVIDKAKDLALDVADMAADVGDAVVDSFNLAPPTSSSSSHSQEVYGSRQVDWKFFLTLFLTTVSSGGKAGGMGDDLNRLSRKTGKRPPVDASEAQRLASLHPLRKPRDELGPKPAWADPTKISKLAAVHDRAARKALTAANRRFTRLLTDVKAGFASDHDEVILPGVQHIQAVNRLVERWKGFSRKTHRLSFGRPSLEVGGREVTFIRISKGGQSVRKVTITQRWSEGRIRRWYRERGLEPD